MPRSRPAQAESCRGHDNLGNALRDKGQLDEAIAEHRLAIRLKPDLYRTHNNLGSALRDKGELEEAIAEFREAIRLKPTCALAHTNLGVALCDKGRLDEGIAEHRLAIGLKSDSAPAHSNLSTALCDKGQLEEAIAECREAIRLEPDDTNARLNLVKALYAKGQLDEAIAECREHIRLKPNDARARSNLGAALRDKGQLDEAIAECREAIRVKKDYAEAHLNLGGALYEKGQLDAAIAECREAIRLKKDYAKAHYGLGNLLAKTGRLDEAIAEYREAIRLKKHYAEAHGNLGTALAEKGLFSDALVYVRRAHELGSKNPRWPDASAQWVRNRERLVELDRKLPAILAGKQHPSDTAERLALAELCQLPCKRQYVATVRFFADAFADDPKLAGNLNVPHRYNAACAAALAGCGQGKDADNLDDKKKRLLREQALAWLRPDLDFFDNQLRARHLPSVLLLLERLAHAQNDPDFKGVRDSMDAFSESEQAAWRKLWADTDQLLKQARAGLSQTTFQGTLTDKARQQTHEQQLEAGRTHVIDMRSQVFDTYLKVLDAKGNVLAENDDIAPNNLNSRVLFTPKEAGTFNIVATSFEERGRGAYTVTVTTLAGKRK